MKKNHLKICNLFLICILISSTAVAQTSKTHTEKFKVDDEVRILVNSSHSNVKIETWDKNEVEVTFTLEAPDKVEELFEKWNFKASGDPSKITIEANSGNYFDIPNFEFDFDMEDLNLDMQELNLELQQLNVEIPRLNLEIDNMVNDIMKNLNLEDIPESPFGENTNFNSEKYEKDPDGYLKKINKKHGTQVTKQEVDQWLEAVNDWSEDIEINMGEIDELDLSGFEKQIEEQTKDIEKSVEKWQKENEGKIEEMTKKIEEQMKDMNFEKFQQFNYFDQDRSDIKKMIHIKLPKKAKLQLNVRYGEVTLAENLQNINADLNYASLSANIIKGKNTDISASYAPIFIDHWQNGQLNLSYCNDITIKKINSINLKAQGTDIFIGTLLNAGNIQSSYGDLEIKTLGTNLQNLSLELDFGTATLALPDGALDLMFKGNKESRLSIPTKYKILSDTKSGNNRIVKAYKQKPNSGQTLSVRANYGELTIR